MATLRLRPPVPAEPSERAYWITSEYPEGFPAGNSLTGRASSQIAIIGGGLTGLWAAKRILELDPAQEIIIVEADFCGSGASGRNGGQLHGWYGSLGALEAVVGKDEAVRLAKETTAAIEELQTMQSSGEVDMDLRLDGWVWGSTVAAHDGAGQELRRRSQAYGVDPYSELDEEKIQDLTGSGAFRQGIFEGTAGTLNPFKLILGLKQRLEEQGVRIYENSPVLEIHDGDPTRLTTPHGEVLAERVLVATNAWAGSIPEINRYMYALDSFACVTEPIPEVLNDLGLTSGAAIADSQTQVVYYQRTKDGRLLFGNGTGKPIYKDRLGAKNNRNSTFLSRARRELSRLYPSLKDVNIEQHWIGPVDVNAARVPQIGTLKGRPNVYYCVGWGGTALAQIPVVARTLASVLLGVDDEWSRSRLVNQKNRVRIFPEPFRYVGAVIVRGFVIRQSRLEGEGRRADLVTRLAIKLIPKAPKVPRN